MKRFKFLMLLASLFLSLGFVSCGNSDDDDKEEEKIPQSGAYFKFVLDNQIWKGSYMPEYYVVKYQDILTVFVCSDALTDSLQIQKQTLTISAKLDSLGQITSTTSVQYYKNKDTEDQSKFDLFMIRASGDLVIKKEENNKMNLEFKGKLKNAKNSSDIRDVNIYIQEIPVRVENKKIAL